MTLNAEQAAFAAAALWVVHTVDCANYGRMVLTGSPTPDGEPSPKDMYETTLLHSYAMELTTNLTARANRLGLHAEEVEAGRTWAEGEPWGRMQADYVRALNCIGGRLTGGL